MNLHDRLSRFRAKGGYWIVGQAVILLTIALFPSVIPQNPNWPSRLHSLGGIAVAAIGATELLAGFISLGSGLTPYPKPRDNASLNTEGAFKFVRHPIYGGLILLALGFGIAMPSPIDLLPAIFALAFFDRKASAEERWLMSAFPDYVPYRENSKKFWPGLY